MTASAAAGAGAKAGSGAEAGVRGVLFIAEAAATGVWSRSSCNWSMEQKQEQWEYVELPHFSA
jgi:hypothetical protein